MIYAVALATQHRCVARLSTCGIGRMVRLAYALFASAVASVSIGAPTASTAARSLPTPGPLSEDASDRRGSPTSHVACSNRL